MKTNIIILLTIICIWLFVEKQHVQNDLSVLQTNIETFGIHFSNWDNGEKLLFIHGIQTYDIGFAIDNNNQLFWHQVDRLYDAGPSNYISALGVCKNGKYAARPAGCFNKNEYFEKQPFFTETCNLFK